MNSVDHDNLRIDVWDFNPEENVSEKFKKFGDIKDSRGLRKFIKETVHASAGKTTYDLLGSVEIPLKVSSLCTTVFSVYCVYYLSLIFQVHFL